MQAFNQIVSFGRVLNGSLLGTEYHSFGGVSSATQLLNEFYNVNLPSTNSQSGYVFSSNTYQVMVQGVGSDGTDFVFCDVYNKFQSYFRVYTDGGSEFAFAVMAPNEQVVASTGSMEIIDDRDSTLDTVPGTNATAQALFSHSGGFPPDLWGITASGNHNFPHRHNTGGGEGVGTAGGANYGAYHVDEWSIIYTAGGGGGGGCAGTSNFSGAGGGGGGTITIPRVPTQMFFPWDQVGTSNKPLFHVLSFSIYSSNTNGQGGAGGGTNPGANGSFMASGTFSNNFASISGSTNTYYGQFRYNSQASFDWLYFGITGDGGHWLDSDGSFKGIYESGFSGGNSFERFTGFQAGPFVYRTYSLSGFGPDGFSPNQHNIATGLIGGRGGPFSPGPDASSGFPDSESGRGGHNSTNAGGLGGAGYSVPRIEDTPYDSYGAGPAGPPAGLSSSLFSLSGQSSAWNLRTYSIPSQYQGFPGRVVFRYISGNSFTGDIMLDAIERGDGSIAGFEASNEGFETSTASTSDYELATFSIAGNSSSQGRWNRWQGGTGSASTGNTVAYSGSWKVYAETSGNGYPGRYFWLRSSITTLGSNRTSMQFAESRYGATIGSLNVYWYSEVASAGFFNQPEFAQKGSGGDGGNALNNNGGGGGGGAGGPNGDGGDGGEGNSGPGLNGVGGGGGGGGGQQAGGTPNNGGGGIGHRYSFEGNASGSGGSPNNPGFGGNGGQNGQPGGVGGLYGGGGGSPEDDTNAAGGAGGRGGAMIVWGQYDTVGSGGSELQRRHYPSFPNGNSTMNFSGTARKLQMAVVKTISGGTHQHEFMGGRWLRGSLTSSAILDSGVGIIRLFGSIGYLNGSGINEGQYDVAFCEVRPTGYNQSSGGYNNTSFTNYRVHIGSSSSFSSYFYVSNTSGTLVDPPEFCVAAVA